MITLPKELEMPFVRYGVYPDKIGNSELIRWTTIDPLLEKYHGCLPTVVKKTKEGSPYNYTLNNPLRFIDPDGREAVKADPDDPEENRFAGKPINNTPKDLSADSYKLGDKNAVEITKDASNRVSAIGNAIDKNAPKVLNGLSFVLLPISPPASAFINYAATAWTVKNDLNSGNFDNSAVSIATTTISATFNNEYIKYSAQGAQIIYDLDYLKSEHNGEIRQNLRDEIQGKNMRQQLENYRKLGNFGF